MGIVFFRRAVLAWLVLTLPVWCQTVNPSQKADPLRLESSSQDVEAGFLFRQGLELLDQGQYIRATDLFRKALVAEPARIEVRPYLAQSLLESKDYEESLKELDLYLKQEPTDTKASFLKVKVLAALKRYAEAADALATLQLRYGEGPWEWENLRGFLAEKDGNVSQAESAYKRASELNPEALEPQTSRVALYLQHDRTEEAAALVQELLRKAPDDPAVLNAVTLLLAKQDPDFDPSELLVKLGDKRLPFELQYNLAASLAQKGTLDRAGLLAADLVDRYPDDARATWLYGRVLLGQGELQDAGRYLLAVRDRLPAGLEMSATLGMYAYQVGDYEGAIGWFKDAKTRDPKEGSWDHDLSLAYSHLDRLDEALASSRQAVTLMPSDPRVLYQLALVLERQGDVAGAMKAYQNYLGASISAEDAAVVKEHLEELSKGTIPPG